MQHIQSAISHVTSYLSPIPRNGNGIRIQPKRNAKKKPDENFVYETQTSTSSLLMEATLSESQFFLDSPKINIVPDTQEILSGDNSITFTQSQIVVPETQASPTTNRSQAENTPPNTTSAVSATTPLSRHGRQMCSSLSSSLFDSSVSLLAMNDLSNEGSANTATSTPLPPTLDVDPDISTKNLSRTISNKSSQTVPCVDDALDKSVQTMPSVTNITDTTSQTDLLTLEESSQTDLLMLEESSQTDLLTLEKSSQTDLSGNIFLPNCDIALFRSNGNLSTLSNFHMSTLRYRGLKFRSAEHAYQHQMATFHGRHDIARRIMAAKTAPQAKKLSHDVKKCSKWLDAQTQIMSEILKNKSEQCHTFKRVLLETGAKRLVHNIDTDSFWGCGPDLCGKNVMGLLLQDLREDLKAPIRCPATDHASNPAAVATSELTVSPGEQQTVTNPSSCQGRNPQKADTSMPTPEPNIGNDSQNIPLPPCPPQPPVLLLGNSNVRDMTSFLQKNSIDANSIFYPGGTLDYIRSRVKHTTSNANRTHIVLMAGDIEAADGVHPELVTWKYELLVREIMRVYPYARLILTGLATTGNSKRRHTLHKLNALMQRIASNERLIAYVNNDNAKLKDRIHLSYPSKISLSRRIAEIVKKPHLECIQRFR